MRTKIVFTKYPYIAFAQSIFERIGKLPKIKVMKNRTVIFEFDSDLSDEEISAINDIVTLNSEFKMQKVEKVK